MENYPLIIIPIIALALAMFWCYQFAFLMMMEESLFPGKQDKLIWGVIFALVAPLAPFAFLLWRKAVLSARREGPENGSQSGPDA